MNRRSLLWNHAQVAFTLHTGTRDKAIAAMKFKHVDLIAGKVEQDAREVQQYQREPNVEVSN